MQRSQGTISSVQPQFEFCFNMSLTLKHTLPKVGTIRFDLDNCPQIQKQVFQVSRLQIAGILRHPAPLAPEELNNNYTSVN